VKSFRSAAVLFALGLLTPAAGAADQPWVVFEGGEGPGKGKHVVLISGDEEYRSEETLPQLAKMLARRRGFKCTVLFAIDPKTGEINPEAKPNTIPGLEALQTADLMVIFTRFRNLPDEQMKYIDEYLESGKPVVGLRTATHGFQLGGGSKYAKWTWNSKEKGFEGGFGRKVLGETWVNHHGQHGKEGTRGLIAPGAEKHPILRGIKDGDVFGTTDVYTVNLPLPGDSQPLVLGQVVESLNFDAKPVAGKKNDPMMPVAWTKTYEVADGKKGRVFATTMGASQDFAFEGTRRMIVNACLWATGLEDAIPEKTNVDLVGEFKPSPFKFGGHVKGVKPSDLAADK
jgi:type 1 glutamine amidotransferase